MNILQNKFKPEKNTGKLCQGRHENTLTFQDSIRYLLDEENEIMIGSIRAKGKCPICQSKFTEIKKLGFVCIKHQITPKRLYIDFFNQGQRYRLFADKSGQVLDSYQRAVSLLSRVSTEIENHTFN